jgi:ribosomal protein S18 acetylase RimI-like enzyme
MTMVADFTYRDARRSDARDIAELFQISSDGVADYVWSTLTSEYPGLSLIEIGEQRYARDGGKEVAFSFANCVVAEAAGHVVGMMHAYPMPEPDPQDDEPGDPILQPYAELELPGSLYVSGIALRDDFRNRGGGTALLAAARKVARAEGLDRLSLLVFEQNAAALRLYQREGFVEIDRRAVVPHEFIHYTGDVVLMAGPLR